VSATRGAQALAVVRRHPRRGALAGLAMVRRHPRHLMLFGVVAGLLLGPLAPVVVLIGLIALTIASFGVGATDGPLQVALMLSAAFASMVALKNGHTSAAIARPRSAA
jgi:hypothetical protein